MHDRIHQRLPLGSIFRCYLKLHDSPKSTAEEDGMSKMAPAQKKKMKKQKKAEERAKKVSIFSVLSNVLTLRWLKSGLIRFRKLRVRVKNQLPVVSLSLAKKM